MTASYLPLSFTGSSITGAGHGKELGTPTVNIDLHAVPPVLEQGVYASFVTIDGKKWVGALHYGPRHSYDGSVACEVHLLDTILEKRPDVVDIRVVQRIRDVQAFSSLEELKAQIAEDIRSIRSILASPF
ncbi:MAG: Riboflavin biosynthesis protein RibF [Candidatus Peribacteria bacterium]|nr:Riboflavin biosynthesis protein RibF [Candidatus Peribacteria bacterium]